MNAPRLVPILLALSAVAGCGGGSGGGGGGGAPIPPNAMTPASAVTVDEPKGFVEVTIERINPAQGEITLEYATGDGSAAAGADYESAKGTLLWGEADDTAKTIRITILDDKWDEGVEQFEVRFFNLSFGTLQRPSTTVFVLDDEQPVPPTDAAQFQLLSLGVKAHVAPAGDVDGDGFPDLVAGEPDAGTTGRARVFSGRTGVELYAFVGGKDEVLGGAVARAGDVDGDGRDDVACGVAAATWIVRVFSGKDGKPIREWPGSNTAPGALAIAGAGDHNGDGNADVLVGFASAATSLAADESGATLISGKDGKVLLAFAADGDGEGFGAAVAVLGDVDADQVQDLLVGAPKGSGSVYLFSGKDAKKLAKVPSPVSGAAFGSALAVVGDVDGDSVGDFAVGAPAGRSGAGNAYLYSGRTRQTLLALGGLHPLGAFGTAVAAAGDADGDGKPDVLVGEPESGRGSAHVYSGKTGSSLRRFDGPSSGTRFGEHLAFLGDTNGDGRGDVAASGDASLRVLATRPLGLATDRHLVSVSAGGRQTLRLAAGAASSGRLYLVAGSFGTQPGFTLGGVKVPLNPDAWFNLSIQLANTGIFVSTRGRLDGDGKATAFLEIAKGTPAAAVGVTLYHAFVVFDERNVFHYASEAAPLTFAQ